MATDSLPAQLSQLSSAARSSVVSKSLPARCDGYLGGVVSTGKGKGLSCLLGAMYAHRHAHEKGSSQEEVPSWEGGKSLGKSLRGLMGGSSSDDDAIGHWADDRGQARGRRNRDEKGLIEIYGRGLGSMVAEHSRANKLASPRLGSASSSSSSLKAILDKSP